MICRSTANHILL
uniref:Uncharacterized protein n=1 Tax=Lepeophtheirus salmonis TaxID=72036 RepID=A0A0K2UZ20_LEPSM